MILITGATGFVGRALLDACIALGQSPLAVTRRELTQEFDDRGVRWESVPSLNSETNWLPLMHGIRTVVHCAGLAHFPKTSLAAYRSVNVEGTLRLAKDAAAAGVQRFVFLSSVGVHGVTSKSRLCENHPLLPADDYALSKLEAEHGLSIISRQTGLEVVIIRPPLVYGPGAPGNFRKLINLIQSGIPLPLAVTENKRSLVAIENLISFMMIVADCDRTPKLGNQVFLISDATDVSTSSLLRKIAKAAGKQARLFPLPNSLLWAAASIVGKRRMAEKVLGSLQIDASKARTAVGWEPVVTIDQQLTKIFDSVPIVNNGDSSLRIFDVLFASFGLVVLSPLMLLIFVLGLFDTGSPLFTQERVGRYQRVFKLVKFRTMKLGTASVSTHLVGKDVVTRLGGWTRHAKLDELPQLWNVLKGDMSLVGPRPCLPNQTAVIHERNMRRVYDFKPGITGRAQINNIDMSNPKLLAETDAAMLAELNVSNYLKYIFLTIAGKGKGDALGSK